MNEVQSCPDEEESGEDQKAHFDLMTHRIRQG
jgi:hypothetical protein